MLKKKKRNEAVAELPNSVLNINNIWKWAMKHECDKKALQRPWRVDLGLARYLWLKIDSSDWRLVT